MFQNPYFYPNYIENNPFTMSRRASNNLLNGITRETNGNLTRNIVRGGIFSRLSSSLGAFKNINWTNLINNTSKTLGVINQTIPLVKQAGPMFRNIKSVLKLVSVFKDETDLPTKKQFINKKTFLKSTKNNLNQEKKVADSQANQPTFFIN